MTQPVQLISLAEVSRKLDIPFSRAQVLLEKGVWVADFTNSNRSYFLPSRLKSLAETKDYGLMRAIKANAKIFKS